MTNRSTTVEAIASALGLSYWGDGAVAIMGASAPHEATSQTLAIASTPAYAETIGAGKARAALLWAGADPAVYGLAAAIFAPRPRYALSGLSALMDPGPEIVPGAHPTAQIDPSAQIGDGAAIGPFVVIGARARIGANARIAAHTSIGADAVIGADALILERCTIGARCRIGDRFIAQPGIVVGSDGFSFVTPEPSAVESIRKTLGDAEGHSQQKYARIHSLAAVTIGDDVEIGANSCIDRGTLSDTRIGDGTKLDNLVHVGHNVVVGRDCLLCGQVGIAGSTVIGDRCVFGGQVGIGDNLKIGNDVIAAGATALRSNQPDGRVMMGNPALSMEASIEAYKGLRRLPRLFRDVADLRKHLSMGRGSD